MNFSTDPNTTIHARIETNKMALAACYPLPHLPSLEGEVAKLTPRAVCGNAEARSDLSLALTKLDEGKEKHRQHDALKQQQEALAAELAQFEHEQRQARLRSAESAYLSLKNEFGTAAKSLCRLHQQMVALNNRNNYVVPGWKHRAPPEFNVPALNPSGWMGNTSDMLPLPWMNAEKEAAA